LVIPLLSGNWLRQGGDDRHHHCDLAAEASEENGHGARDIPATSLSGEQRGRHSHKETRHERDTGAPHTEGRQGRQCPQPPPEQGEQWLASANFPVESKEYQPVEDHPLQ